MKGDKARSIQARNKKIVVGCLVISDLLYKRKIYIQKMKYGIGGSQKCAMSPSSKAANNRRPYITGHNSRQSVQYVSFAMINRPY